jgi:hypothetical protein
LTLVKERIRALRDHPQAYVVYDNFQWHETLSSLALGSSRGKMRTVTTGMIVINPYVDKYIGLRQSQLTRTHELNYQLLVDSPAIYKDDTSEQISKALIADAILRYYPGVIEKSFATDKRFPRMPVIDVLEPRKYEVHQLGPIFFDEGSLEGTYGVHQDIWLRQLGLDRLEDFRERLWIVGGDHRTTLLNRSIRQEQRFSTQIYDRRDWLVSPSQPFHLMLNFLYLIVRTHYGDAGNRASKATLLHDLLFWDRPHITRENCPYHLLKPLILEGWDARVIAMTHQVLKRWNRRTNAIANMSRKEDFCKALSNMSMEGFLQLVDEIWNTAFTGEAWQGVEHQGDVTFTSQCRFIQQVETFKTLEWAVKHGDIGLFRRIIDIMIFYFIGSEQTNYANEMLYFRWLLSEEVSDSTLQRAILSSCLINIRGQANTFLPADLVLEHINLTLALALKAKKNSTFDLDHAFSELSLCGGDLIQLRSSIEPHFGVRINADHSKKKVDADVHLLAHSLLCNNSMEIKSNREVTYASPDVLRIGGDKLFNKLGDFNRRTAELSGLHMPSATPLVPSEDLSPDNLLADISAHAMALDVSGDSLDDDLLGFEDLSLD